MPNGILKEKGEAINKIHGDTNLSDKHKGDNNQKQTWSVILIGYQETAGKPEACSW